MGFNQYRSHTHKNSGDSKIGFETVFITLLVIQ